jgi:hypothetical protein
MLLQTFALPACIAQPCTNDASILISANCRYLNRENDELRDGCDLPPGCDMSSDVSSGSGAVEIAPKILSIVHQSSAFCGNSECRMATAKTTNGPLAIAKGPLSGYHNGSRRRGWSEGTLHCLWPRLDAPETRAHAGPVERDEEPTISQVEACEARGAN